MSTRRKKVLLTGIVCVLALVIAGAALLSWISRQQQYAGARRCTTNLRQIGQGVYMYANANGGAFPDTVEKLITAEGMSPEVFVCPHASDTPAPGATAQAQAANLSKGGHLSYVYVGKGMSTAASAKTVLAYEPLTNHGNGIYVLFADGHVEFIDAGPAAQLIADVEAGKNPPGVKASAGY